MMHKMKLNPESFEAMKNGDKNIEIRLNDQKRQRLAIDDTIEFSKLPELKKKLMVRVEELLTFKIFRDLYDDLNDGADSDYFRLRGWDGDSFLMACRNVYGEEREKEYGVLGIRIKIM